jgi:hypothetical protein
LKQNRIVLVRNPCNRSSAAHSQLKRSLAADGFEIATHPSYILGN